jgi:hypothetical protein
MAHQSLNYRATSEDLAKENQLKRDLEQAWECTLHHLPHLYHVDFFAERSDDLVAWVEVKHRSCTSDQYPTVFRNEGKKFKHLQALSLTAPALFVVRWADGVTRFIDVAEVVPEWLSVGGERDRWGPGEHDFERVFEIPIGAMKLL